MASVYSATDTRVGRPVALKVLARDVAEALGEARFHREVHTVGNLNHPNILPLYDSGSWDGELFYVMPLVDGEALRDRMRRGGALPADLAVRYACEVADALAHAHARGIIHRDVTPGNIMISGDHAVLMDFGIARSTAPRAVAQTGTGMAVGTPGYMSPEQASGDPAVDGRSDLYALGCVLYEMLTGEPPYSGPTAQAIIARHLIAPVPSVRTVAPSLPVSLDLTIARAMAKDPNERFTSMEGFRDALTASRSDPALPAVAPALLNSLVVLPFGNLSQEPDSDWFSDGLTEEIISSLSQLHGLRVISRTSAMRLKGSLKGVREIARELGVRLVLEGSVRRAGHQVRITAHLIEADTERTLWSDRFAGALDDVFDMQESIARRIAEALALTLTAAESRELGGRPLANIQAHDYYLRAKHEFWALSPEALARALGLLEHARGLTGASDLLEAASGLLLYWALDQGVTVDQGVLVQADLHADRALALNPRSATAHALKGGVAFKQGRMPDAVAAVERALALEPNNVDALAVAVVVWPTVGRIEESRSLTQRLLMLDPLTPPVHCMPGFVEWWAGNVHMSPPSYLAWYTMDPRNPFASLCYAHLLFMNGNAQEADRYFDITIDLAPASVWASLATFFKGACRGEPTPVLAPEAAAFAGSEPVYAFWVAIGYAAVRDRAATLHWLGQAHQLGFANTILMTPPQKTFLFLEEDADFRAIRARVGERQQEFKRPLASA